MRFCTTHRACESVEKPDCCRVYESVYDLLEKPPSCTLVEALIVTKEDGRWPEWVYVTGARTGEILDTLLAEAAKETP